jgi:hypothetical protein
MYKLAGENVFRWTKVRKKGVKEGLLSLYIGAGGNKLPN